MPAGLSWNNAPSASLAACSPLRFFGDFATDSGSSSSATRLRSVCHARACECVRVRLYLLLAVCVCVRRGAAAAASSHGLVGRLSRSLVACRRRLLLFLLPKHTCQHACMDTDQNGNPKQPPHTRDSSHTPLTSRLAGSADAQPPLHVPWLRWLISDPPASLLLFHRPSAASKKAGCERMRMRRSID